MSAEIRPWTSLPDDRDSVRIVTLHEASSDTDPICCNIQIARISERPWYEALSYRWDNSAEEVIHINGSNVLVGGNLASALRALRQSDKARLLWIDALCIDQENNVEKSFQVPMMRAIYGSSAQVIVWLGVVDKYSEAAMKAIRGQKPNYHRSIPKLLRRGWFGRIWMVQELALAPRAIVQCGSDTIEWEDFMRPISLISELGTSVNLFGEAEKHFSPDFYPRVLNATRRRIKDGQFFELNEALRWFQPFDATNPKDKAYGLIGLLKDPSRIHVDYQKSTADLYQEIAVSIIKTTQRLDIFMDCFQNASPSSSHSLPTWVPDWSDINQPFNEHIEAYSSAEAFSASQSTLSPEPLIHADGRSLAVYGHSIGYISELGIFVPTLPEIRSKYWPAGHILPTRHIFTLFRILLDTMDSWKSVAIRTIPNNTSLSHLYPTNEPLLSAFYSTLTKSSPLIISLPALTQQAKTVRTLEVLHSSAARYNSLVAARLPWPLLALLTGPIFAAFGIFLAIMLLTDKYSFEFTEQEERGASRATAGFGRLSTGLLGMFPAPSLTTPGTLEGRVGDEVLLLKGAARPFVVRRVGNGERAEGEEERWRLVGDAYVHGIMHGGAWREEECKRMWLQ